MTKLVLLLILCLGACSSISSPSYSDELQHWVGRSEYLLYNSWGMPANVSYINSNKKMISYIWTSNKGKQDIYDSQIYYQGINNQSWWSRIFGPPRPKNNYKYYCKTSFIIENSTIIGFNFNGDYCTKH